MTEDIKITIKDKVTVLIFIAIPFFLKWFIVNMQTDYRWTINAIRGMIK
jgi:hypothetical protein